MTNNINSNSMIIPNSVITGAKDTKNIKDKIIYKYNLKNIDNAIFTKLVGISSDPHKSEFCDKLIKYCNGDITRDAITNMYKNLAIDINDINSILNDIDKLKIPTKYVSRSYLFRIKTCAIKDFISQLEDYKLYLDSEPIAKQEDESKLQDTEFTVDFKALKSNEDKVLLKNDFVNKIQNHLAPNNHSTGIPDPSNTKALIELCSYKNSFKLFRLMLTLDNSDSVNTQRILIDNIFIELNKCNAILTLPKHVRTNLAQIAYFMHITSQLDAIKNDTRTDYDAKVANVVFSLRKTIKYFKKGLTENIFNVGGNNILGEHKSNKEHRSKINAITMAAAKASYLADVVPVPGLDLYQGSLALFTGIFFTAIAAKDKKIFNHLEEVINSVEKQYCTYDAAKLSQDQKLRDFVPTEKNIASMRNNIKKGLLSDVRLYIKWCNDKQLIPNQEILKDIIKYDFNTLRTQTLTITAQQPLNFQIINGCLPKDKDKHIDIEKIPKNTLVLYKQNEGSNDKLYYVPEVFHNPNNPQNIKSILHTFDIKELIKKFNENTKNTTKIKETLMNNQCTQSSSDLVVPEDKKDGDMSLNDLNLIHDLNLIILSEKKNGNKLLEKLKLPEMKKKRCSFLQVVQENSLINTKEKENLHSIIDTKWKKYFELKIENPNHQNSQNDKTLPESSTNHIDHLNDDIKDNPASKNYFLDLMAKFERSGGNNQEIDKIVLLQDLEALARFIQFCGSATLANGQKNTYQLKSDTINNYKLLLQDKIKNIQLKIPRRNNAVFETLHCVIFMLLEGIDSLCAILSKGNQSNLVSLGYKVPGRVANTFHKNIHAIAKGMSPKNTTTNDALSEKRKKSLKVLECSLTRIITSLLKDEKIEKTENTCKSMPIPLESEEAYKSEIIQQPRTTLEEVIHYLDTITDERELLTFLSYKITPEKTILMALMEQDKLKNNSDGSNSGTVLIDSSYTRLLQKCIERIYITPDKDKTTAKLRNFLNLINTAFTDQCHAIHTFKLIGLIIAAEDNLPLKEEFNTIFENTIKEATNKTSNWYAMFRQRNVLHAIIDFSSTMIMCSAVVALPGLVAWPLLAISAAIGILYAGVSLASKELKKLALDKRILEKLNVEHHAIITVPKSKNTQDDNVNKLNDQVDKFQKPLPLNNNLTKNIKIGEIPNKSVTNTSNEIDKVYRELITQYVEENSTIAAVFGLEFVLCKFIEENSQSLNLAMKNYEAVLNYVDKNDSNKKLITHTQKEEMMKNITLKLLKTKDERLSDILRSKEGSVVLKYGNLAFKSALFLLLFSVPLVLGGVTELFKLFAYIFNMSVSPALNLFRKYIKKTWYRWFGGDLEKETQRKISRYSLIQYSAIGDGRTILGQTVPFS